MQCFSNSDAKSYVCLAYHNKYIKNTLSVILWFLNIPSGLRYILYF